MSNIEVRIERDGALKRVGTRRRQARRGGEATTIEYHDDWLADADAFLLEPALRRGRGVFAPADGHTLSALYQRDAKAIAKQVGDATATWRDVAQARGARECERMRSAFEHADLEKARRL